MAITELSRLQLNQEFRDGERPSGDDFASAWLSTLNKTDDGVKIDANGNLEVARGVKLKDSPTGDAGTLRFNGGQVQFHDGTSFKNISAGAGAFTPVTGGVAFAGGNVGIGTFASVANKLEVNLGANTAADQRVRFGNVIMHNGTAANPGAYICHSNPSLITDANFALLQDTNGNTTLNSGANATISLSQNNVVRFRALVNGDISITPGNSITLNGVVGVGNPATPRDLTVFGNEFKPGGGPFTATSDIRVKKDIRSFGDGLEKILALKPVAYRYNGRGGTSEDGNEYVGLVAQEVQEILPELVSSRSAKMEESDKEDSDILTFEPGPITYILINAVKELAARIENLEKSLTSEKGRSKNSARAHH